MKNKQCWCGSDNFHIRIDENRKNCVCIICSGCKAERRVNSPGVGVNEYDVGPKFKEKSTDEESTND